MTSAALDRALDEAGRTPVLALDPALVVQRYTALRDAFGAAVLYAVKACPEPAVLRVLADAGSGFDVASQAEIEACLAAGADPSSLCHGNPVRGPGDAARAYACGVRRFVTDSAEDVAALAAEAPGARVLVRLLVADTGSATPFFGKFGALPAEAVRLLALVRASGLVAAGVTFHAGSQQTRPDTYAEAVATALDVAGRAGLTRPELDLGGGWPVPYREPVAPPGAFVSAVRGAIDAAVARGAVTGADVLLEPGRALVAEAGVLRARVLRVSRRPGVDHRRWVYLDVGRYQGLAETEGEAIGYPLRVPGRGGPDGPVVLAGPTCDGDDVIYRRTPCALPLDLAAGDVVDLLCAGAYTSSYASVGFNGFGPLPVVIAGPVPVTVSGVSPSSSWAPPADRHAAQVAGGVPVPHGSDVPAGHGLPMSSHPVGRHVLAEIGGIDPATLDDPELLRSVLDDALVSAGAQVRQIVTERFEPQGVTVVAVLAESHASVHTWPELGGMHVDVFTCGDSADPVAAVHGLAERVGATETALRVVDRGGVPRTITEPISDGLTRSWALGTVHHSARTEFQRVVVADTPHGVTLFCDDERQSTEHTQLTYHEALVWPGALLTRRLDRVLIVGSSEGVASEMAVAAGATHVDHVDIDTECVRICAEHLPYGYTPDSLAAAERGDGPIRLTYGDGRQFVLDAREHWDLIVVDLPDERPDEPDAQINRLYEREFVQACADRLTDGGVLVFQAGSPAVWRDATLRSAWQRFDAVFGATGGRAVYVGCEEHEWAFLAGVRADPGEPGEVAAARLPGMPARPETIDETSLRHRLVAPLSLRRLTG